MRRVFGTHSQYLCWLELRHWRRSLAPCAGSVHDPQHRPVAGSEVILKAQASDYTQKTQTDANGEFHFDAVPLGSYSVTVSDTSFATQEQTVTVLSGTAPILHFELHIVSQAQSVTVSAEAAPGQTESVTPTTLVDRQEIQQTPGASRTNSLAMIANYTPGSCIHRHDQLHVRGGHQVSWLIDGVPMPNTNIASNLGPQIDPSDIDTLEMQRGSYSADFGDRTYGVFNVAPRTGFERNNQAELILSAGSFYQTDDQLNFGGHTNRFAYYASLVNGNRTNLGLETPTSAVIHDGANGYGGFGSFIYNATSTGSTAVRDASAARLLPGAVRSERSRHTGALSTDFNRENDSFATSWVRSFNPGLVLTVSPYYHYNSAKYGSNPLDVPSAATENRSSKYEGGQAVISWIENATVCVRDFRDSRNSPMNCSA